MRVRMLVTLFEEILNKYHEQKKHRREISVTDVMPKIINNKRRTKAPELQNFNQNTSLDFLSFCKKFRITMRSLVFIQYFTVGELLKLKLVHSHLNQIIDQNTIEIAIQIGNLTPKEREYYWETKTRYSMDTIYRICPTSMVDLIKNNDNKLINSIKNTLLTNLPRLINHNEEILTRIIAHLFIENKLYRIHENQSSVRN